MGLESGTLISDLNETWPLPSDERKFGDDHLRLIKSVMKNDVVEEAPSNGNQYARQNGSWSVVTGGGGASVTISDTAPSSPAAGNMWWKSDTGNLYLYYNDGTSSQWVPATVNGPGTPAQILANLLTVDGTGSGLDADLLDGQDGSYYASAASVTAGDNLRVLKAGDTMTGALTVSTGNITATAGHVISGSMFLGPSATTILGVNTPGPGTISLRPTYNSTTNQTSISSTGVMTVGNSLAVTGGSIYTAAATGVLTLSGGASSNSGANIELFGPSHASFANMAYYDADLHTFRTAVGTPTGITFDALGTITAGSVTAPTINTSVVNQTVSTSALTMYGGTSGDGAWMQLFGGSHASLANRMYCNADSYYFRNQAGSQIAMALAASAVIPTLSVYSLDATANPGPYLILDRQSPDAAANDSIGGVLFYGRDSTDVTTMYGRIMGIITDPTNASEDGEIQLANMVAGVFTERLRTTAAGVTISGSLKVGNEIYGTGSTAYTRLAGGSAVNVGARTVWYAEANPTNPYWMIHYAELHQWRDNAGAVNATLNAAGDLTVTGSVVASGGVATGTTSMATGGYFIGTSAAAILGVSGSTGAVYLRPNGYASAVNQAYVDTSGNAVISGIIGVAQDFYSSTAAVVLGTTGAGTVYLRPSGRGSGTGQMTIDSVGNIVTSNNIHCNGGYRCRAGTGGGFYASYFNIGFASSPPQCWIDVSNLGNFTLTSDYRIKKDIVPLPSMWERVKALRPVSYTQAEFTPPAQIEANAERIASKEVDTIPPMFADDNIEKWGFIAHEVQEDLLPTAANGVKDSSNEVQSLNIAVIVAALTKALQEAMGRIEALESAR